MPRGTHLFVNRQRVAVNFPTTVQTQIWTTLTAKEIHHAVYTFQKVPGLVSIIRPHSGCLMGTSGIKRIPVCSLLLGAIGLEMT